VKEEIEYQNDKIGRMIAPDFQIDRSEIFLEVKQRK
jgi:hypothetical protein